MPEKTVTSTPAPTIPTARTPQETTTAPTKTIQSTEIITTAVNRPIPNTPPHREERCTPRAKRTATNTDRKLHLLLLQQQENQHRKQQQPQQLQPRHLPWNNSPYSR
uniref:Uncharacterized protein n=1 Tax=Pseudo-nitzschia australis TaxID=44445 RepID=A0A6U9YAY5_9STRA|mmetsp:Transcript_2965/g.5196  ORF Transcript_2965/g.5196 Transcript_2965/m.5196 type:complete len:107 (+) Transcript_2965:597-917(+)